MTKLNEKTLVGTSEFAAVVGKSPQWIRQLTRENVLAQVSRGKYNLAESIQSYIDFAAGSAGQSDKDLNLNKEKALLTRAKRIMAEKELKTMDGELHRSEDVEKVMTKMLMNARSRLLAIPSKAAPLVIGNDEIGHVQEIIKKEVYEALNELANYDPGMFSPGSGSTHPEEQENDKEERL